MYLVEHVPIARAVARAALAAGARRVLPYVTDLHLRKAAIELGPEDQLGVSPEYLMDWVRSWHDTRPAIIQLAGEPEPELFSGLDPLNVRRIEGLLVELNRRLSLTMVVTSHHLPSSLRMAHRLVFIVDGRAVSGPPSPRARFSQAVRSEAKPRVSS